MSKDFYMTVTACFCLSYAPQKSHELLGSRCGSALLGVGSECKDIAFKGEQIVASDWIFFIQFDKFIPQMVMRKKRWAFIMSILQSHQW
ncbi:hypothetical protein FRX31_030192 [Thalictrum thalictroides]|uniref:Uncharacterized protein n=1 Tax=Thalictrum thalictroides TaxID=46969 RepID=A0A7J6V570_THATH|nr:hypothetical protein FRX31_030192 [Thalictrum thalictroides]